MMSYARQVALGSFGLGPAGGAGLYTIGGDPAPAAAPAAAPKLFSAAGATMTAAAKLPTLNTAAKSMTVIMAEKAAAAEARVKELEAQARQAAATGTGAPPMLDGGFVPGLDVAPDADVEAAAKKKKLIMVSVGVGVGALVLLGIAWKVVK